MICELLELLFMLFLIGVKMKFLFVCNWVVVFEFFILLLILIMFLFLGSLRVLMFEFLNLIVFLFRESLLLVGFRLILLFLVFNVILLLEFFLSIRLLFLRLELELRLMLLLFDNERLLLLKRLFLVNKRLFLLFNILFVFELLLFGWVFWLVSMFELFLLGIFCDVLLLGLSISLEFFKRLLLRMIEFDLDEVFFNGLIVMVLLFELFVEMVDMLIVRLCLLVKCWSFLSLNFVIDLVLWMDRILLLDCVLDNFLILMFNMDVVFLSGIGFVVIFNWFYEWNIYCLWCVWENFIFYVVIFVLDKLLYCFLVKMMCMCIGNFVVSGCGGIINWFLLLIDDFFNFVRWWIGNVVGV